MNTRLSFILPAMLNLAIAAPAFAEPTEVEVRVLAQGAKFVGGYQASMQVAITDADTGERLAEGMTRGGTGDTGRILSRQTPLSNESSAVFRVTLDIERARKVIVSASGPHNQLHAVATATTTLWLLPGRDLTNGDGLVLDLPGLIVDLASPVAYHRFKVGSEVPVTTSVTMMCGCAFSQDGPWRTDQLEIDAYVYINGEPGQIESLAFNSSTGHFEGELTTPKAGFYEVEVRAWMPTQNNTGVVRTAFFVD